MLLPIVMECLSNSQSLLGCYVVHAMVAANKRFVCQYSIVLFGLWQFFEFVGPVPVVVHEFY